MDNRQLTYFLAIVEEGNITKAAERLHIAQPYLSQQLKFLEDELGVKLIERTTRKFQITDAGLMLRRRAEQILELTETTVKELKDFDEGIQGTLSIGSIATAGATLLEDRVYTFHKKYPNISFQIREGSTFKVLEMLKSRVIEIGIIRTPLNPEILESIYLPSEPMVAATSIDLSWSKNEESIYLTELKNQPLLVDRRYENMIIDACEKSGFQPKILCVNDDPRLILSWANKGIGVAIVPATWINLVSMDTLKIKEINAPSLTTQTAIVWLKNKYLSTPARNFLKTFQE
ncbi:LysR family transcriptional regulator [Clostridium sp. MSJ-11]|uniref:LysR family transcriptional regulator n=1 Tax=Clostridium mobile TaxID=2841512 RepID=A0ABS6EFK8_9CLOT|nr:LysR family transcriptional regulator [Clostridium mobile]MBU5483991.1 LysR family transcriptional regulator [Clostridium mobile]